MTLGAPPSRGPDGDLQGREGLASGAPLDLPDTGSESPAPGPAAGLVHLEVAVPTPPAGGEREASGEPVAAPPQREAAPGVGVPRDAREALEARLGAFRAARKAAGHLPLSAAERERLRVVVLADRMDAPSRYRCVHACEQLRQSGVVANLRSANDPALADELPSYSVMILFRLGWTDRVADLVARARAAGATVGFDIDDLVFHPGAEPLMPFLRSFSTEKVREYRHQFRRLRATVQNVDFVVGSTPVIAEWARREGKDAFAHPNVLPRAYERLAQIAYPLRPALARGSMLLGYMSGSNTHDDDLESIAPALAQVLGARPEASLVICGHSGIPIELEPFAWRIARVPFQDWRVYPWLMARCRAVIAPISARSDFTDAKSALKVFEAGAFGVPVVASPIAEYERAVEHGVSGFVARDHEGWVHGLDTLCELEASLRFGAAARKVALAEYTQEAYAHTLARELLARAGHSERPVPDANPITLTTEEPSVRQGWLLAQSSLDLALGGMAKAVTESPRDTVTLRRHAAPAAGVALRVAGLPRDGRVLRSDGEEVGFLLADRARPIDSTSRWKEALHPIAGAVSPGTCYRSGGSDPFFLLAAEGLDLRSYAAVLVEMKARVEGGTARAQLFWRGEGEPSFAEGRSAAFDVAADGQWHSYVLELGRVRARFPERAAELRFDPIDAEGSVEVATFALLRAVPEAPAADEAERALARRFAAGKGRGPRLLSHPGALDGETIAAELPRLAASLAPGGHLLVQVADATEAALERRIEQACRAADCELVERATLAESPPRWLVVLRRIARPGAEGASKPVDIVIPIYNAREMTLRCVESVLAHATGDWRLILVDDASPDEELAASLRKVAAKDPRVVYLRNRKNLGFTGTANRGMRYAGDRDVLLLNSDTEVFTGFLDRLRVAAYANKRTGILTPFSNNATICSIPNFAQDNVIPPGYTPESWAQVVTLVSRQARPEIVTGVGFCMYVKAAVVAKVGYLDEKTFGRGFGEENDLCERAKKAGFTVRLCDDVFVYHKGKASFGDEGRQLEKTNGAILERRHPGYHAAVAQFCRTNPLAPLQAEIRFHLPRLRDEARSAPLFVLHASPFTEGAGGTEFYVRDLVRTLAFPRAVIAYPSGASVTVAEVFDGRVEAPTYYSFPVSSAADRFCTEHAEVEALVERIVELFGVSFAHLHHLMFWPAALGKVLRRAGVPYVVSAHDYYLACPSWNLFNYAQGRAARCEARECAECLPAMLRQVREPRPCLAEEMRQDHARAVGQTLEHAAAVLFPSEAARANVQRLVKLPRGKTRVVGHGYELRVTAERAPAGPHLRVALLGESSYVIKGADEYLALLDACRDHPIDWHFFGTTGAFAYDERLAELGLGDKIVMHGRYAREEIGDRLRSEGIDVVAILSVGAETFSFTLSEAVIAGVPVVVTRLGALGERVARDKTGVVVGGWQEAATVLRNFASNRAALSRYSARVRRFRHRTPAENAAEVRAVYEDSGVLAAARKPELGGWAMRQVSSIHRAGVMSPTIVATPPQFWLPAPRPGLEELVARVRERLPDVRRWSRELILRQDLHMVRIVPPESIAPELVRMDGLTVVRRRARSVVLRASGPDPMLVLPTRPFAAAAVQAFRFRARKLKEGTSEAQIYWSHGAHEAFSEEKSALVALDAPKGQWREYTLRFDTVEHHARWRAGERICSLRFDPATDGMTIELGALELCADVRHHEAGVELAPGSLLTDVLRVSPPPLMKAAPPLRVGKARRERANGATPRVVDYRRTRWYPYLSLVRGHVPKAVIEKGKEFAHRRDLTPVRTYDLPLLGPEALTLVGLKVVARTPDSVEFAVDGQDPMLFPATWPISPREACAFRFRARTWFSGKAFAQLFWTHDVRQDFCEEKSAKVVLDAPPGEWREYTIRLDTAEVGASWYAGRRILSLRFDPTNVPANVELGPLELCRQRLACDDDEAPASGPAAPGHRRWVRYLPLVYGSIPRPVVRLGRELAHRKDLQAVHAFPLARLGPPEVTLVGLTAVDRSDDSIELVAEGEDPMLLLPKGVVRPNEVSAVRFSARRRTEGFAYAQLFWLHAEDEEFSEEKSVRVALESTSHTWAEYTARLDAPEVGPRWRAGQEIVALRFDPLNGPGRIELGAIELCASRAERPESVEGAAPEGRAPEANAEARALALARDYLPFPLVESARGLRRREHSLSIPLDGQELIGLSVSRKGESEVAFEVESDDPMIVVRDLGARTAHARTLAFKARATVEPGAYAQFFWVHRADEAFSEEKSVRIPLDGPSGEWKEYRVRLDSTELAPRWFAGDAVVAIRFDPVNARVPVEVGPLTLQG